ncbi:MAG: hypothetical protein ACI83P_001722 [Janthinobacterium sp.]|jgi:uncharacterized protein (DUF1499 family)
MEFPLIIRKIALALAVLALVLLGASSLGVRAHWWPFPVGFKLLSGAVGCGAGALLLALIGLAVPQWRTGAVPTLLLSAVLGAGAAWFPLYMVQQAKALPLIHDISTDLDYPPAFVAVLPLRIEAANSAIHGGAELAAAQRSAYPDIEPLTLAASSADTYARALAAAKRMGWTIVAEDSQSGRIEATATTFWFGFKDDVVVRITALDGGSRVDVRSVSRVGKSDVGANAARIRAYLASL